jgi:uncharacterized membrane protein YjjP (DUF1212 family)
MDASRPPAPDAAHLVLRLGRLMLANGADTAHVQQAVTAFAERLGYRVHLLVCLEGLLLTLDDGKGFRTRLGAAIPGTSVNMGALAALNAIRRRVVAAPTELTSMDNALDEVERGGNRYPRWLVAIGMGITAASLARLFGGVWTVVGVSFLVGVVTQMLRQHLAAAATNPLAAAGLCAFGGGLVGTLAMKAFPDTSPAGWPCG